MAAGDHTIIYFHNGKLMRTLYREERNTWKSLVPFKYNRDALPVGVAFDEIKQVPRLWSTNCFLKCLPYDCIGYGNHNGGLLIAFHTEELNAIFYVNGNDSYVMIGGYGHYANPYSHFFGRGYGETFERKMAKECYGYLMETILPEALRHLSLFKGAEQENGYLGLWEKFRFKDFWSMTSEEQESYLSKTLMEYDE